MTINYDEYHDLAESLAKIPGLIDSPDLYPFDPEKMYAAMMEMAALPLPSGAESPFTSKLPGSVHSILFSCVLYIHQQLAHQFNLVPPKTIVEVLRMMGVARLEAEYPIVNLVFNRSRQSLSIGADVIIPVGTIVQSKFNSGFTATTRNEARMTGSQETVIIPARLNQLGAVNENMQIGEFSIMPRGIPFVESVYNDGAVISPGRRRETLPETVLRAREAMRTQQRCVTSPDYYFVATSNAYVGAQKANVIPGYLRGSDFKFTGSIVTVVVYPSKHQVLASVIFEEMKMVDVTVDVLGAEIIPIDGEVTVRVVPYLVGQNNTVFDMAARAIAERINPPHGKWGDLQLSISLATALEMVEGFYAVPNVRLKHAVTGEPIESLNPKPWQLFQIQGSLVVKNIP